MKALMLCGKKHLEMHELPMPVPKEGEALIRLEYAGICGADLSWYRSSACDQFPPCTVCHEMTGIVEAIADDGCRMQPGCRVTVNPFAPCGECIACSSGNSNLCRNAGLLGIAGMAGIAAEYVTLPVSRLFELTDTVHHEEGVLCEPLAAALRLQSNMMDIKAYNARLVIFGAGLQGIICLILSRHIGIKEIAMVDVLEERLEIAHHFGAGKLINAGHEDAAHAVMEWSDGAGANIAVDSSRDGSCRNVVLQCLCYQGAGLFMGLNDPVSSIDFGIMVRNELKLQGSYAFLPEDFAKAVQMVGEGVIPLHPWIKIIPFAEGVHAFESAQPLHPGSLKVVLRFG
jgi:threonine dehydrogenase-like Zn-dependent dehydrogenase